MSKNIELLLTENVEALGIVGDVVKVRTGFARNYLLPRNMATQPSPEKIQALAAKRADAEKMIAELRKQREELIGKLQGIEVTLVRSCNDQGVLYGSITQQDISTALSAMGHTVKPRDVRINQVMKRIDKYDVHVKLDSDLDATIKLIVQADRKLELERHEAEEKAKPAEGAAPEGAEGAAKPEGKGDSKSESKPEGKHEGKPGKGKPEAAAAEAGEGKKADKPKKAPKEKKADGSPADAPAEKKATGWGKVVDKPIDLIPPPRSRRGRDR